MTGVPKVMKPLTSHPVFDFDFDDEPSATTRKTLKPAARKTVKSPSKGKGKGKRELQEDDDDENEEAVDQHTASMMWVDRYAPSNRDELGVHPRKVQDVHNWLDEAFNPKLAKYRRLLVMSGPSGAAKTATLKILAEELDIEVLEFTNSSNIAVGGWDNGRDSLVQEFTQFLHRAGISPALTLAPDASFVSAPSSSATFSVPTIVAPSNSSSQRQKKRLILLEDLPNTSHYGTKLALRSALSQYLSSPRVTCPLVMIISEAMARPGADSGVDAGGGGSGMIRGESFDAHSICGNEILDAAGCRQIAFNPIAATIMKKALIKILDRIYTSSSSSSTSSPRSTNLRKIDRPSTKTLELIIHHSSGDIRSALMSLQFLASAPGKDSGALSIAGDGGGKVKKKSKMDDGGASAGGGDVGIKKLLFYVTARENSLFIFHALGKVLYSKRWDVSAEEDKKDLNRIGILQRKELDRLPKFSKNEGRNPSKVDPDMLFAESPVDPQLFLTYLHHNYPPFAHSIEQCSAVIDALGESDSLLRAAFEEGMQSHPPYSSLHPLRSTLHALTPRHHPSVPINRPAQILRKATFWEMRKAGLENEASFSTFFRDAPGGGRGILGVGELGATTELSGGRRGIAEIVLVDAAWEGVLLRERERAGSRPTSSATTANIRITPSSSSSSTTVSATATAGNATAGNATAGNARIVLRETKAEQRRRIFIRNMSSYTTATRSSAATNIDSNRGPSAGSIGGGGGRGEALGEREGLFSEDSDVGFGSLSQKDDERTENLDEREVEAVEQVEEMLEWFDLEDQIVD